MAETAPFVSLESQDDMWDDDNSEDLSGSLQPPRVHFTRSTRCTWTNIAVSVFIGVLIIIIVVLSVLVARRNETKDMNASVCLKFECIKASHGKYFFTFFTTLKNYATQHTRRRIYSYNRIDDWETR